MIACASAGDFARFNPHLHAIFLEGGFDREGQFAHLPSLDLAKLSQYFRSRRVAFFLKRSLLNEPLARNMLGWTHSGFSVDLSLKKMLVEEHAGSVLYHSEYHPYFRTNSRLFPATEFLVEVLQHLPDAGARLIRRYGLYSSRSRGTWSRKPHLTRLAPEGWQKDHPPQPAVRLGPAQGDTPDQSVSAKDSRAAWARLLAKVYEVDALRCTRCGSPMRVLAVITDPPQVLRILRHLIKTGTAPPGLDPASLN